MIRGICHKLLWHTGSGRAQPPERQAAEGTTD